MAVMSAKGGNCTVYNNGGGGGGRIAIWHNTPVDLRDAIYREEADEKRYTTTNTYANYAGNIYVEGGAGTIYGTAGTTLFLTAIPIKGTLITIR